jgi:hypothetical protein
MGRSWRPVAVITSFLILGLPGPNAAAHLDVRVTICIPSYAGGPCYSGGKQGAPSYMYGDVIIVRGRTKPAHVDGRVKILRRKGESDWRKVATRALDDDGKYHYKWQTSEDDVDQGTPYRFRVRLPDHDTSPVHKVYVLFRE